MASIFNQYSFVLLAAALAVVSGLILLSRNPKWHDYVAFGVITAGLVIGWVFLHPRQTPLMDNAKAVQSMIGSGKPVLLEFQSPY